GFGFGPVPNGSTSHGNQTYVGRLYLGPSVDCACPWEGTRPGAAVRFSDRTSPLRRTAGSTLRLSGRKVRPTPPALDRPGRRVRATSRTQRGGRGGWGRWRLVDGGRRGRGNRSRR